MLKRFERMASWQNDEMLRGAWLSSLFVLGHLQNTTLFRCVRNSSWKCAHEGFFKNKRCFFLLPQRFASLANFPKTLSKPGLALHRNTNDQTYLSKPLFSRPETTSLLLSSSGMCFWSWDQACWSKRSVPVSLGNLLRRTESRWHCWSFCLTPTLSISWRNKSRTLGSQPKRVCSLLAQIGGLSVAPQPQLGG